MSSEKTRMTLMEFRQKRSAEISTISALEGIVECLEGMNLSLRRMAKRDSGKSFDEQGNLESRSCFHSGADL
jgi:hypothetical protein